jgi:hypothetical protein
MKLPAVWHWKVSDAWSATRLGQDTIVLKWNTHHTFSLKCKPGTRPVDSRPWVNSLVKLATKSGTVVKCDREVGGADLSLKRSETCELRFSVELETAASNFPGLK